MTMTMEIRDARTPRSAVAAYARRLSRRFDRYFRRVVSVDWVLDSESHERVVRCRVHSRSGFYRVLVHSSAYRRAMDLAFDKLVRQRRRMKAIRENRRRASMPPQGKRDATVVWPGESR